ncbi:MAG: glycosyl hydrolase family 26 [Candidatus Marinimicrobia bacterium]|nr:glycosyl hydrolase family 26 [Candidatus Neomarinimicrobiota bacterium]
MARLIITMIWILFSFLIATAETKTPVNSNTTPEARQLLEFLYSIAGKQTLAGQHNAPIRGTSRLSVVHRNTGKYPVITGHDFGFSFPGYWDGINYRQQLVDEAIRRHEEGFINTIMWHAVVPTHDEPVTFQPFVNVGKSEYALTDDQWKELTTAGTLLNERWKSQVDVIAWFLKQLKYAEVPVLWRPYHEMNGFWFWWCGKPGQEGYVKLYRMLYDRLVNFHKLDNLLWVWNANELKDGVTSYKDYYPGDDVVDILATDVYSTGFNDENYEKLLMLAKGKLIAIGECGTPPTQTVLKKQPAWVWFMKWDEPDWRDREIYQTDEVMTLDELPWVKVKEPRLHYPVLK